jgi:hypothetical protein
MKNGINITSGNSYISVGYDGEVYHVTVSRDGKIRASGVFDIHTMRSIWNFVEYVEYESKTDRNGVDQGEDESGEGCG